MSFTDANEEERAPLNLDKVTAKLLRDLEQCEVWKEGLKCRAVK